MHIYHINRESASTIQAYESKNASNLHIAREMMNAQVSVMYLSGDGLLGYHQAAGDQLFVVVEGEGWVSGADHQQVTIRAGETAFWHAGEWHEAGSEQGLTAMIIEADHIIPELDAR